MDAKQEYMMKLQVLEQEANQLGEQINLIEQQITELGLLKVNLERLEKAGEEEIFAELGKGIFLKAQLKKSNLLIDVGSKVLVPKSYSEVKDVIKDQSSKFAQVKVQVGKRVEQINAELNRIIAEANAGSEKASASKQEENKVKSDKVKESRVVVKKKGR